MRKLILVCCGLMLGCATDPPPPAGRPVMAAADNGQPKMQATMAALQAAKGELEAASPNKGGHRENALGLVQQAIDTVAAGMRYAAEHPNELGVAEGPAPPEPVNEVVPGAERQPHMANAMVQLREARRQLLEAKHDKGGARVQGVALIDQAMRQIREGINFANTH